MRSLLTGLAFYLALTSFLKALPEKEDFVWNPIRLGDHTFVPVKKVKEFYEFEALESDDLKLTLSKETFSLGFTLDSHIIHINGIKLLMAQPVRKQASEFYLSAHAVDSLIHPLFGQNKEPVFKKLNTVVLDAGHGGHDLGAVKKESKLTLTLALKIKALLEEKGLKVVMTRNKDEWVSLEKRVSIANSHKDAVFVSLHFNSGNRNAKGFESYVMSSQNKIRDTHAASISLALSIHSHSLQQIGKNSIEDRGIRRAKFRTLKSSNIPAVLIEAGFLTNEIEATMITSEGYQTKLAQGITNGIIAYQKSLKRDN